jgi:phage gp29-like protein
MEANKQPNLVSRAIIKAANYIIPKLSGENRPPVNSPQIPQVMHDARYATYYIAPLQLQRTAHDVKLWRDAITSAENAWYPTRYYMQRMYVDTILDGHTFSCMKRRRNLTLLKDFVIKGEDGKVNDEATKLIKDKKWFRDLLSYILDAQFYGYSLIQLGDLMMVDKKYTFPRLTTLRRWNVEPDRQNLVSIPLQKTGINFLDPEATDPNGIPYADALVYVDTPTDIGHSICGYGLLYNVAIYAIILKNNLANNADYTQMFATPYRHAKTPTSLDVDKRAKLEQALDSMGASGWIITDEGITIEFNESNTGTGFQSYDNLEKRCEKKISKIILGHENASGEEAGKLGGSQGDDSPVTKALLEIEKEQDSFCLSVLNDTVMDKLIHLGFPFKAGSTFGVTTDKEEFAARKKEDEANTVTATLAKTMKDAGFEMDEKYFAERTKIPVKRIKEQPAFQPSFGRNQVAIQNKLAKIYGNGYHHHEPAKVN